MEKKSRWFDSYLAYRVRRIGPTHQKKQSMYCVWKKKKQDLLGHLFDQASLVNHDHPCLLLHPQVLRKKTNLSHSFSDEEIYLQDRGHRSNHGNRQDPMGQLDPKNQFHQY